MTIRNDPEERFRRMTTEPVSRLIPALALPTIASMLVTALYNMADTYYVGRIDTSATAAVGIVFPLMSFIQMVGMTFGVGAGSPVSQLLGRKEVDQASRTVSTAFFTAAACGALITVFGELFLDPLMRAMGSTETILPYAREYGRFILLGAPFMAASFVMNVCLRSEGSAVLGMIGITTGAVINIVLDPIFMFTLGMGIKGAAIATVLSQLISFAILLSHYLMRRSALRLVPANFTLEPEMHREILKSGMPTFFRQGVASLAAVMLNAAAGGYGDTAIAGMTIVTRIMLFMSSVLIGFGQGFQPVAAFNYTAGRRDRVLRAFWFSVKVGTAGLLVFAATAWTFAPAFVRLFRDDPEVVRIGAFTLRAQCITMPLTAFIVMSNMMFQYIGQPWRASLLALSRQGLAFMPALLLLSRIFGLPGIQASQAVADLATFLLALPITAVTLGAMKQGV